MQGIKSRRKRYAACDDMAEMERFARRGHRAGTHTGTETCPRHVSLAALAPFSNLPILYEKQIPRLSGGSVFMSMGHEKDGFAILTDGFEPVEIKSSKLQQNEANNWS